MLINTGLPLCLYGFSPLSLRLTGILTSPTHHRVPQRVFADCLRLISGASKGPHSFNHRLLDSMAAEKRIPDDPDGYDKQTFDITPRKNEFYYKYEISNHARKGRTGLRRALELFKEMKSEARLTPHFNHFNVLIYGCSKAGQTKKAFELYDECLKYCKRPSRAMVTCLINACAECPIPEYGLKRLEWLRTHLQVQFNLELSDIHYKCMIKAYGKLGRLDLAVKVFKEMIDKGIQPTTDAFNMLMIGCASQKESGALLALRIYKRMRLYGIKPDSITYSTFLRCVHYCGMGSPELLRQTLLELPAMTSFEQRIAYKAFEKNRPVTDASKEFEWVPSILGLSSSITTAANIEAPPRQGEDVKLIEGTKNQTKEIHSFGNTDETALTTPFFQSSSSGPPNLLSDDHLTLMQRIEAIQFDKLNSGVARFQLFGGADDFLDIMKRDDCEPDIRIFSRLCALVRPDRSGLLPLFHQIKEYPVTRNDFFYNNLIKITCSNYNNPKRVDLALCFLEEMHRDGLRPSVSTFEALAFGCDTLSQAITIIDDIERCGFVVSSELVEQLMRRASSRKDFAYLIGMIDLCRKKLKNFLPTRELLECLEAAVVDANALLVLHEKGKLSDGPRWLNKDNIALYDSFKGSLGNWLRSVEVQEEEHPFEQFDVKSESKRQGFVDYVREFRALELAKKEALEKGEELGNLYAKVIGANERQPAKRSQEHA